MHIVQFISSDWRPVTGLALAISIICNMVQKY